MCLKKYFVFPSVSQTQTNASLNCARYTCKRLRTPLSSEGLSMRWTLEGPSQEAATSHENLPCDTAHQQLHFIILLHQVKLSV